MSAVTVMCALCSVKFIVCSLKCIVQYTVHSALSAVHSILCALYNAMSNVYVLSSGRVLCCSVSGILSFRVGCSVKGHLNTGQWDVCSI